MTRAPYRGHKMPIRTGVEIMGDRLYRVHLSCGHHYDRGAFHTPLERIATLEMELIGTRQKCDEHWRE